MLIPRPKVGELVWFDGLQGMVPCKIIAIRMVYDGGYPEPTRPLIDLKVTAKRYPYDRGHIIEGMTWWHVVPRKAYRPNRGQMIKAYRFID